MRVTREKAEQNHQAVIATASRLFREQGFDGIGVSSLMQAAGLTHGGFYKQFKSKDDLIARATRAALDQTRKRLAALTPPDAPAAFATTVGHYLSEAHRDAPGKGCALVALGADAARHGPELRSVMQQGIEDYLDLLTADGTGPDRDTSLAALSTMVGALLLARAVADPDLSHRILATARAAILAGDPAGQAGPGGRP